MLQFSTRLVNTQPLEVATVPPAAKPHLTTFTIDGEPYSTEKKTVTAGQLLADFAHLDAASHYLIEVDGRHQESFEGRPGEVIHLHEGHKFISAAAGPTPVS